MFTIILGALLYTFCANADGRLNLLDTFHHTHYAGKGAEISGVISMANTGDEVLKVKVYLQDFSMRLRKEPLFTDPGLLERSNAGWIHLPYTYFEIPPFTRFPIPYTLNVPKDPGLQGSYWSVIMIESAEDAFATSFDGTSMQVAKRFAYQTIVRVGDQGIYRLNILGQKIEVLKETKWLVFDVENSGTLTIRAQPFIELIDGGGKLCGSFSCSRQMMHPLCSSQFYIDLSSVPLGNYQARVVFKQNEDTVLTSECPIEVPDFFLKTDNREPS